jgi:hypothetical protein
MTIHLVDKLRPEPLDVDPDWDARTLATIMDGRGEVGSASVHRWPARLMLVAAAVALLAGGVVAAHRWLPRDDAIAPAAPAESWPTPDAPYARDLARMDLEFPTEPTDQTFEAVGTRDFRLGKAPADSYVFMKLGAVCPDGTKYLFILNGDRNAASANCGPKDDVFATASEFPDKTRARSDNVVTIEVNGAFRYTVTVGYRTKSMYDVGPRGVLPDGRTYGYQEGNAVPDMLRVRGVGGVTGYVDHDQLSALPSSPEEAVRIQEQRYQRYRDGERVDRTIPVYDTKGRQVDTYEVMLPEPR